MNSQTILVAEDNSTNRELIREILEARGHRILEACDGEEALALTRSEKPSLALIDIQMPKLSGLQLIQLVRQDSELAKIPMIALTAFAMKGDRESAIQHGFDGYVSKPFNIPVLLAEIDRCANARQGKSVAARIA